MEAGIIKLVYKGEEKLLPQIPNSYDELISLFRQLFKEKKGTVKFEIHQGGDEIKSENYGYCIGPIFNFFRYYSDNKKIMNKNMYNQIEIIKQPNKMTLLYEIKEDPVRIFGKGFVERNKNNCYLLINGKERELCRELYKNEINPTNGIFNIILIEKKPITDMSFMFSNGLLDFR